MPEVCLFFFFISLYEMLAKNSKKMFSPQRLKLSRFPLFHSFFIRTEKPIPVNTKGAVSDNCRYCGLFVIIIVGVVFCSLLSRKQLVLEEFRDFYKSAERRKSNSSCNITQPSCSCNGRMWSHKCTIRFGY